MRALASAILRAGNICRIFDCTAAIARPKRSLAEFGVKDIVQGRTMVPAGQLGRGRAR